MKNKEYVKALWECYQKGIVKEGLEEKDVFFHLINDAINQVVEKLRGSSIGTSKAIWIVRYWPGEVVYELTVPEPEVWKIFNDEEKAIEEIKLHPNMWLEEHKVE